MDFRKTLEKRQEMFPVYGLGIFMLVAGLSKFVILDLWLGYEPRFLVELVPLTARQLTMFGGLFEASLGLALLSGRKTFYVSLGVAVYLFAITLQLVSFGLWDLAIRDFGLTLYALSVAVWNYGR
ncbi:MAG: putative membrane protein YphA (DoxX/SURF4 family) [Candidatus Nanohaloarchaea archaeon]|jgi:uncharacterized membrane protein YphA (DoxX/SURF4 family)